MENVSKISLAQNTQICAMDESQAHITASIIRKYFRVQWRMGSTRTKLEGHWVECIYLRQRFSDGSVNKTILKPRLALANT